MGGPQGGLSSRFSVLIVYSQSPEPVLAGEGKFEEIGREIRAEKLHFTK